MDWPSGELQVVANDHALIELRFSATDESENTNSITEKAVRELTAYFNNNLKKFTIPLEPKGTTFQKSVWQELNQIPFGSTISYLDLAKNLGDEKVIRAAASANGKNPIPIIIPCHRVIGSDGSLTGYSGGLEKKRFLLQLEGILGPDLFS
ncbi:MAG: methylated-DNA--[protein]-cysteine S-methyltransferase [Schleiferiaceae bacterium]|jgi:methylated-DNA-[protein]-cysteine S-methyltransferase|nr:methylated-DNA--[protein]-cysteine S-methyltransferase [Schleiferiaceae bacterium]